MTDDVREVDLDGRAARLALDGVPVYPRSGIVRRWELGREVAAVLGATSAC